MRARWRSRVWPTAAFLLARVSVVSAQNPADASELIDLVPAKSALDFATARPEDRPDVTPITIPPYPDVADCGRWSQPLDTTGLATFLACPNHAYLVKVYRTVRYPLEARRQGTSGTVVVAFDVTPDGSARRFRVVRSVSRALDAEAVRSLKAAGRRWVPGMRDGVAVPMGVEREVVFRME